MDRTLDRLIGQLQEGIQHHLEGLHAGMLTPDEFQQGMAQDLLVFHSAAYLAGLDADELDETGRQAVIQAVQRQLDYLDPFVDAIDRGELSDAETDARALLYAGSINSSWWKGATDGRELPAQPGEDCECGPNCRCQWEFDGDEAYWICADDAASCPTCLQRGQEWAPYLMQGVEV